MPSQICRTLKFASSPWKFFWLLNMSLVLNIGEGTIGQLPRQHGNQANLSSGNLQISPLHSDVETQGFWSIRKLPKSSSFKDLDPRRLQYILFAAGILLDPFFNYIKAINNENMCIGFDKSFGITICALRTFFDISNLILYRKYELRELNLQNKTRRYFTLLFHVFSFHPIPLVVLICVLIKRDQDAIMVVEGSIQLQMIVRLIRLVGFQSKQVNAQPTFELMMAYVVFAYIYVIGFVGAACYSGAIDKEFKCHVNLKRWDHVDEIYCNNNSEDLNKLVNEFCSTNTTNNDFGIYREAHPSGILDMSTSSPLKILYFTRWSMQQLSSFGQSLETGLDVNGNIIVISIFTLAMLLSFGFIGRVQIYSQFDSVRLREKKKRLQETEQWMPFQNLSQNLQLQLKKHKQDKWEETKVVNIENMLYNLPKDLRGKMNHELCLELLKKVEEFRRWGEALLEDICDCVKPVFFAQRTRVIQEGDPIDEMIFVVQGKLWTYTRSRTVTRGSPRANTSHCNRRNKYMKDGDLYGEELIDWLQDDPYTSDLPISKRTIQAVTNVEAFVIMAYDLKNIFIKYHEAAQFIQWRFRWVLRLRRNTQSPTQEASTSSATQSQ